MGSALRRLATVAATSAVLVTAAGGAAMAGTGTPSASFTPNTDPDLSCPYAMDGSIGHHGGSFDGTLTTQAGTLTFSVPDPQPGGSR